MGPGPGQSLLNVSINWPTPDISYKCNHTLCSLPWLVSFTSISFSRFIVLNCVPVFYSFSLLNNMPSYGYTTCCLSIHHSVDIWLVSALGLSWMMLPWTSVNTFLVNIFPLPWPCPGSGSAGHVAIPWPSEALRGGVPEQLLPSCSHEQCERAPSSPRACRRRPLGL